VYIESSTALYVPRCYGVAKFGAPSHDKRPEPAVANMAFAGTLRPMQCEALDAYLAVATGSGAGAGTIAAACGSGKTVIGIAAACRLGVRTLVVVHKGFLLTQWQDRIREYAPSARVGTLQGARVDVDDCDIVIASLQSIVSRGYTAELAGFGFAIFDEAHHLSARVFCTVLHAVNFRYMLALTATPDRKDGLAHVFQWFLGDVVWRPPRASRKGAVVVFNVRHPHVVQRPVNSAGRLDVVQLVTCLCAHAGRTRAIADLVLGIRAQHPERNVLVLSERRQHLQQIHALLGQECGWYVGGMKAAERALAESAGTRIVLATYSLAAEGMDLPRLDTLVLASPKSDVEQAVGRVMRRQTDASWVYDIHDRHREGAAAQRATFYRRMEFEVCPYHAT
jgi:superfamily II DNA or RNA helicase